MKQTTKIALIFFFFSFFFRNADQFFQPTSHKYKDYIKSCFSLFLCWIINLPFPFFSDSVTLECFWLRVTHGSKTATKHNLSKINPWWRQRLGGGRWWRIERNQKPFINLSAIPQPYPQSPSTDSTLILQSDVSPTMKNKLGKPWNIPACLMMQSGQ